MAALCLLALAQEVFHPQVELTRKEKKVVAWVSGEEGSLFYADYGDLLVGELQALSPERVQVESRAFFRDLGSAVEEGLKVGERVELHPLKAHAFRGQGPWRGPEEPKNHTEDDNKKKEEPHHLPTLPKAP